MSNSSTPNAKSKAVHMVLGIIPLTGSLGIHNFYAGRTGKGITKLLLTILLSFTMIVPFAMWIWGLVEAITTKDDATGNQLV